MEQFQRIDLMLKDIGPASDAVEQIVRIGDQAWDILLTGDVVHHLRYDQQQEKLIFTTEVGEPNPDNVMQIFHALLQFNALRDETGGVTMGLADTMVQQSFEMNVAATETPNLQAAVENLAEKALTWRIVLQSDAGDIEPETVNPGLRV